MKVAQKLYSFAAGIAETKKKNKYKELENNYEFTPVAVRCSNVLRKCPGTMLYTVVLTMATRSEERQMYNCVEKNINFASVIVW